jgi:fructoselysine transporter
MNESLHRRISLLQATAINMIDMVGIGPFVVVPLVIGYFKTPLFLWAWIFGALIAFVDGMIWSELGAAYPKAGGSYHFLRVGYGEKWGRMMSFLFVWQTSIQAPLVVASGAIGFAQYAGYLMPMDYLGQKALSVAVILLVTFLLYRRIETIGRISVLLWICVLVTMGWIIFGGMTAAHPVAYSFLPEESGEFFKAAFWLALGQGSVKTIYSYLGYYNVCHLGGEIKNPQKNIPRSIFISVTGIALLYLCMNLSIVRVIPWQEAKNYEFIVSIFIERLYGVGAARIATVLVLIVAFSSLFAVLLGYSRVPYAAALDGNFFKPFARVHPTRNFPHVSLLFIAGLAVIFSFSFTLKGVISAILAMRILVQFIAQTIGLVLLRRRSGSGKLPFRMFLYPLPVLVSVLIWLFVLYSTGEVALYGFILALAGVVVYFYKKDWEEKKNRSLTQSADNR